ncbi:DUF2252 family protein [Methylotenera sp.]|uniref:DUF2252 domain-containing protein n=1 Tax=Methylotenera sp. TaxID=2051956 RepID=UPI0024885240|nr:DUF2252 family protein [Methylotenera sp.]MDI1297852.1 DUF2252 family protein [Methylotenera sp.]
MNIIKRILVANQGRDPERLKMKYDAMRSNSFIFLRGTCHLFYDRLPKDGISKSAPRAWCCGDLHLENFGSYKGDNRLVYFDINDFDEAALAPCTWELSRIMTSILIGAKCYDISSQHAESLLTRFIDGYISEILHGKARWVESETATGIVKDLLNSLQRRNRIEFLNARTLKKGKLRKIKIDGQKALSVSEEQRINVIKFMDGFAKTQPHPAFFTVLDVAKRVAGTGSLGIDRYTILVEGKSSPDQNYLLDLKKASPSSIASHLPSIQPEWISHADRVVNLQFRMQAVLMAFLHAVSFEKQSYVLKALQPEENRVPLINYHDDIESLDVAIGVMAQCVAWAQLRSSGRQGSANTDALIDFARGKKWRSKILALSHQMSQQVQNDWETYCKAYDNKVFC